MTREKLRGRLELVLAQSLYGSDPLDIAGVVHINPTEDGSTWWMIEVVGKRSDVLELAYNRATWALKRAADLHSVGEEFGDDSFALEGEEPS